MKMVQSFWTPPNARLADLTMGWLDLRYHLLSWVLSAYSIRKFYPKLELVTDERGAEILLQELQLPYTQWRLDLQDLELGLPSSIWAAKKMFAYTLQEEPFLHLDGDVSLWAPFPAACLSAPLCAQNQEIDIAFYRQGLRDIKAHFAHKPALVQRLLTARQPIIAANAGIIGGHHLDFIRRYVEFGWTFLRQNRAKLAKIDQGNQNVIIEQLFFAAMAQAEQVPLAYLLAEPTRAHQFPNLTNFSGLPGRCTYIHLMGGKKYPTVCEQLEQRVRLDYPEAYYRVLQVLRKQGLGQHLFFFSLAEEKSASTAANVFSLERLSITTAFGRTLELLRALRVQIPAISPASNAANFVNWAKQVIARLHPANKAKVVEEVLELEWGLQQWRAQLLPLALIEAQKRQNAARWDRWQRRAGAEANCRLRLNPQAFVWDCEWDWAEKKEFKQQVERSGPYQQNLKRPPGFFRLVGLVYPQQGLVREYLADPLSVVLLDALTETADAAPSLATLLAQSTAIAQGLQPDGAADWHHQLLERCAFLVYHWVVLVEKVPNIHPMKPLDDPGATLPPVHFSDKTQFSS